MNFQSSGRNVKIFKKMTLSERVRELSSGLDLGENKRNYIFMSSEAAVYTGLALSQSQVEDLSTLNNNSQNTSCRIGFN